MTMIKTPDTVVLIPAYQPGEPLLPLLKAFAGAGCRIVLVDDGSGSTFREIFKNVPEGTRVLTHEKNLGKGEALKTGLAYIRDHFEKDTVIVTADADGQHRVEDAMKICRAAAACPGALVLGSRTFEGSVPLRSRLGNAMTRIAFRLSAGLRVRDTQTGLRAFHINLLPRMLEIEGSRYEYEMNVLLSFARAGVPILEEEIPTIYIDGNASSHFDTVRDSFRVFREILRFSASSLTGFAVDYLLYSLLLLLTGSLPLSNVGARMVSASVNYSLNRNFVFRHREGFARSAFSYFLLAAVILFFNTLVLEFLVTHLGAGRMAAKLITELFFFIISWSVQRTFIFKKGNKNNDRENKTRSRCPAL